MPVPPSHHDLPAYADWVAPKGDGEWLLWPVAGAGEGQLIGTGSASLRQAVPGLSGLIASNQESLYSLTDLRNWTREQLGLRLDQPIIATGHQIEMHHPGVWVKTVVMSHLARICGGQALYLAVDTDSPKHLALTAPQDPLAAAVLHLPITDDPNAATAPFAAAVAGPTPAHIARLEAEAGTLSTAYGYELPLRAFLERFRAVTLEQSGAVGADNVPLARVMADATHGIDARLGLDYTVLLASTVWATPAFVYWLGRMLIDPLAAATTYNAAIDAYRRDNGITAPGQPMPPLAIAPDRIELPFWLDNVVTTERERLHVNRDGTTGQWNLEIPSSWHQRRPLTAVVPAAFRADPFVEATRLARGLLAGGLRVSARAVTLTLFMRLSLADVFIHGLGGGRYDQVADRWIESWLGVRPPRFIVATATQRLPFAVGLEGPTVTDARATARCLAHALPGGGKRPFLDQISKLPRRSQQRKAVYMAMQQALSTYRLTDSTGALAAAQRQITEAVSRAERNVILRSRELHYCLMPWDVLQMWAG